MNRFAAFAALLALGACNSKTRTSAPEGQVAASQSAAPAGTFAWSKYAEDQLNPRHEPYYSGPVGEIRGIVRIDGDPPPERGASIPVGKCFEAHKQLKSLFRVGPGGELADALVAATGYQGILRPKVEPVNLTVRGCAFAQRTIPMMFGQELMVANKGPEAVAPHLIGAPQRVMRFAIPGGSPIDVRPHKLGHFVLMDRSNEFNTADVYALSYPTAAVSDPAGRFVITGVPVGEVNVNALLPATGDVAEKKVTVVAGQPVEVEFQLTFSRAQYDQRVQTGEQVIKNDAKREAAEAAAEAAAMGSAAPAAP